MIQNNISPDTMLNPELFANIGLLPDDILKKTEKYHAAKKIADGHNATLCGNGSMYRRDKIGFIPTLVELMFDRRKAAKEVMKVNKKEAEKLEAQLVNDPENSELKSRIAAHRETIIVYDTKQNALKVLANSLYGAAGCKYFRYYDVFQAAGITLTGQVIIHEAANVIDAYMNRICKSKRESFVIAMDTDSCYFNVTPLVKMMGMTDEAKIVDFLDKFAATKFNDAVNAGLLELSEGMNYLKYRMNMKRESICAAILVMKKRYLFKVYDMEGVRYATPELKVTGLESQRSSTPSWCRERLKGAYKLFFDGDEQGLQDYVEKTHSDYLELPVNTIAAATSVNSMNDWVVDGIPRKGCPAAIKASVAFNGLVESKNLHEMYSKIVAGDKVMVVSLKMPNPTRNDALAFNNGLPKEFMIEKYIDRESMYNKHFFEPLQRIATVVGWDCEETLTLDDL